MLELKNLTYSYIGRHNRVDALQNVNHAFAENTIYAIEGPSGSGKSTLLSLIAALDKPNSGEILIDGKNIVAFPPDQYRQQRIAMIFQSFCLLPFMTVVENAAYPAQLQGMNQKQAYELGEKYLAQVGISQEQFRRLPSTLSGGEQQRVAIARALCSHAKTILADEPTGNLDTKNAQNIVDILCALAHEQHCTVIMVTHDPAVAARTDVRLTLKDGVLCE